jgi:HEPN domain-containing protein
VPEKGIVCRGAPSFDIDGAMRYKGSVDATNAQGPDIVRDRVRYWIELSDYDFLTAKAMLRTRRYLYVGFMRHQAVEKALKACSWAARRDEPLRTHSLGRLAQEAGLLDLLPDPLRGVIDTLDPLNIESRYPTHKEHLMAPLTRQRCRSMVRDTEGVLTWLKSRL